MRFENKTDLERENKAIDLLACELTREGFDVTYSKLDDYDIDFVMLANNTEMYIEIKGRNKNIVDAFPLPIAVRKLMKLTDKCTNEQAMKEFFNGKRSDKAKPVVVWACLDGLIAADITDLIGEIRWGGRKPRKGAVNDAELMAYFDEPLSGRRSEFKKSNKYKIYRYENN